MPETDSCIIWNCCYDDDDHRCYECHSKDNGDDAVKFSPVLYKDSPDDEKKTEDDFTLLPQIDIVQKVNLNNSCPSFSAKIDGVLTCFVVGDGNKNGVHQDPNMHKYRFTNNRLCGFTKSKNSAVKFKGSSKGILLLWIYL